MHALNPVEPRNNVGAEAREQETRQLLARASATNIKNARTLTERAAQAAQEELRRVTRAHTPATLFAAFREATFQTTLAEIGKRYAMSEKTMIAGYAALPLLREAQDDVNATARAVSAANDSVNTIRAYFPPTLPIPTQRTLEDLAHTTISPARAVIIRSAQLAQLATQAQSALFEALRNPSVLTAETALVITQGFYQQAQECQGRVETNLASVDRITSTTLAQDFSLALAATTSAFRTMEYAARHLYELLGAANPPRPPTPRPPTKTAT